MILKTISAAFATASTFLIAVPAIAVGDIPVKLTQQQAAAVYKTVRPLLVADGAACPTGYLVNGGIVTGGSSPVGGSQTTTIMFNSGENVLISRTWKSIVGKKLMMSVKIDCS